MHKKIVSILSVAALSVMSLVVPAKAETTELINLDFENITLDEFKNSEGVKIFSGMAGDTMEIATENEETGNKAIKLFRKAENVADADNKNGSYTELGFNVMLPEKIESGVVRVSFRVRTADGYKFRSRWKAVGSALTSDGKTKAAFVSHSGYAYTNGTSSVVGSLNSNNWCTITYDVYIEENKITKGYKVNGSVEPSGSKINCSAGDFAGIQFTVAYTNQWWTSCNSGDLCYWVDDILVTTTRLAVAETSIEDGTEGVGVETPVSVTFDGAVSDTLVNSSNFVLSSDEGEVERTVSISDNTVTITPVSGLSYDTAYALTVKKNVISKSEDYVVNFKTKSIISTELADGKRFTEGYVIDVERLSGITYEIKLKKDGEEYSEYKGEALTELGKYNVKITATDENGKSEEKEFAIEIIGAVAPLAENVKITGEPVKGTELVGSYDFKDENGDQEGESTFKWYRSEEKDGEYKEIQGANTKSYTLTDADEDKYIKFAVTPVSETEPYVGEETLSDAFTGAMNPKAENIKVEGEIAEGSELLVSYDYSDENGDEEGESIITWYAMENETADAEVIATGKSYTLTENENDRYIKVGIKPKNAGDGKQEKEFFSEILTGAFKPVVSDVKIIGNLKVGSSVGVDYKYSDKNGDPEGKSEFKWFVDGNEVATGESYTITKQDKGKRIYVEVVPVSTVAPFIGEALKSEVKGIQSSSSTTVSSGGKNSGGGGGGSSAPAIVPINPEVIDKLEEIAPETDEIIFNDILNHWAKAEILEMAEKGIVNGKSEKEFKPDDNITRAEFAAIIKRAYNLPGGENVFSDIAEDAWYKDVVAAVSAAGYMKGSDGKFRPDSNITRQEIAVVLANISRNNGITTENAAPEFADSENVADWAKEDVKFVTSLGLLNGISTGYFAPESDATRAQVVVIIKRLLEK